MQSLLPLIFGIVIALIGTFATFLYALSLKRQTQREQWGTLLAALDQRVALIEMKIGFFWKGVEENLSGLLKRPTHFAMDQLLDKLRAHTITLEECYDLRVWLRTVYFGERPPPDRQTILIAHQVLSAVESLILEYEKMPTFVADPEAPPPVELPDWWAWIRAWWHRLWRPPT